MSIIPTQPYLLNWLNIGSLQLVYLVSTSITEVPSLHEPKVGKCGEAEFRGKAYLSSAG